METIRKLLFSEQPKGRKKERNAKLKRETPEAQKKIKNKTRSLIEFDVTFRKII